MIDDIFSGEFETVKDVEIFNLFPNTHHIRFTDKDIDDIIRNFNTHKEETAPNVKISHTDQQLILRELFKSENIELGEELPQLGLIENMRRKDKSIFADFARVPKRLKKRIFDEKMFKAISPEILMNFRNTGEKFIRAVVLTNSPSLQHIKNVGMAEVLCFSGDFNIIDEVKSMGDENKESKETPITGVELETFGEKIMSSVKDLFSKKETKEVADEPADKTTVSLSEFNKFKSEQTALLTEINELKNKLIEKDNENKRFSESIETIKVDTRKEKSDALCMSALHDGVPIVVIDHFRPILETEIGETAMKFSELVDGKSVEAERKIYDHIKSFFDKYPSKVDMNERSKTFSEKPQPEEVTKMAEIDKRVTELKAGGMSEFDALAKAGVEINGGAK